MPRALTVMQAVAEMSRDYVRHGRPSYSGLGNSVIVTRTADSSFHPLTIKGINKALTKIIKYFSRAVDIEALHFTNETGTSLLFFRPSRSIGAPIGSLPVEVWQDILLLAIGSDGYHPIATTCTSSTFLYFLDQEMDPDNSYIEYVRRRATLRQVRRSWNQFLEATATWWLHVQGPFHPSRTFDLPPIADQVAIVKRLSMTITAHECVGPALNWASNLFQMVQAPISSYNINLKVPYDPHSTYNPHDFLAPVTTKMALRSLRIAFPGPNGCGAISFSQFNSKLRNLVSLSLLGLAIRSTEELTLPLLELLHISKYPGSVPLPTQWDLPRLRHVYIAVISSTTDFNTILNFLRRYASQLESLFLAEYPSRSDLPHDFWDSFTSLQLFGVRYHVLNHNSWSGWDITPPRSHPFRYLACSDCGNPGEMVNSLRSMWTYHEEVALVLWQVSFMARYLVEDIKHEQRTRITETNGILPIRRPDREATS